MDGYFFDAAFGLEQLERLRELVGGGDRENFVTSGRFERKPKLEEIIRRYGEPDLVVATKGFYLKGVDGGSYMVTAYWDRVGFSVYGKHERDQRVHLLTLQAHDFTAARRPVSGDCYYEVVTTKNRVFYRDGKEVGVHVYTGRREWTTLGDIPPGDYDSVGVEAPYGRVRINADGTGMLSRFFPDGKVSEETAFSGGKYHGVSREYSDQGWVARVSTYREGRLHGVLQRFYGEGLKQAEGTYFEGRLHGRAVEFHPNGSVRLSMDYSYGKPISALKEFDESGKLVRTASAGGDPGGRPAAEGSGGSAKADPRLREAGGPAS